MCSKSCKLELAVIKYLNGFSCLYSKGCQTEARGPGLVRCIIILGTITNTKQYLTHICDSPQELYGWSPLAPLVS